MDNQHRKIHGYRELTEEDIALMNKVKELGVQIEAVIKKVEAHVQEQRKAEGLSPAERLDEMARMDDATPERWLAIANTDFQKALMSTTRAVAQPTFY